jgi:opacity protein-like surface antigen
MKKLSLILLVFFFISGVAYSQSIGAFVGYGSSAFGDDFFGEDVESSQANYIPLGAQLLFGNNGAFEFGGEINYAIIPFTFETDGWGETKLNQLYFGALAKFKIGSGYGPGLVPYLRAGAGLYTGSADVDFTDEWNDLGLEDLEMDMKSAFGFNIGAGAEMNLNRGGGLFAEFVYHIVEREFDVDDTEMEDNEPFGANNWAIHVGFRFKL